jgi:hypothetical protein
MHRRRDRSPKAVLLSMTVIGLSLAACGSIVVKPLPEQRHYAAIACPDTTAGFYLEEVLDERGYADSSHIGFTHRGLFNIAARLLSDPSPADILRESLSTLLATCGILAREDDEAKFLLRVRLLGFRVTEMIGMSTETITALLKYETQVVTASSNRQLDRFSAIAESSEESAIDVTRHAERVARDALRQSLGDFSRELGQYE